MPLTKEEVARLIQFAQSAQSVPLSVVDRTDVARLAIRNTVILLAKTVSMDKPEPAANRAEPDPEKKDPEQPPAPAPDQPAK